MPHRTSSDSLARAATNSARCAAAWVLPAVVAMMVACGRETAQRPRASATAVAVIVSNPVSGVSPGAPRAYVSLLRGTMPSGYRAIIRNRGTGDTVTTAMSAGGFDPVAVIAHAGDSVELDVFTAESQTPRRFVRAVPEARRPTVVRIEPRPYELAAPLHVRLVVVFSEPIDAASVSAASVQLLRGDAPIDGVVLLSGQGNLLVDFTPNSPLAATTEYRFVVFRTVRDRDRAPLDVEVESSFTTAAIRVAAKTPE